MRFFCQIIFYQKGLVLQSSLNPNQFNKQTARPTLRWIFQSLEGIDVVKLLALEGPIKTAITGFSDFIKMILSCFRKFVMKIYRVDDVDFRSTA